MKKTTNKPHDKGSQKQSKFRSFVNTGALYLTTLLALQGAVSCSDKENEEKTPVIKTLSIDFNSNQKDEYRNQQHFFDTSYFYQKNSEKISVLDISTTLLYDGGQYFYLMLPEDVKEDRVATVNYMRKKLSKHPQFSYLASDAYEPTNGTEGRSFTNTFNIRDDYESLAKNSSLNKNPFRVPVPIDISISKISNKEFYEAATKAIEYLPNYNKNYGDIIHILLKDIDKDKLANFLTTIALLETGQTTGTIGTDGYHRREKGSHKCFSFGPQHVLMKGPGLKARLQLKLTEGQTFHPINSNMLVLGFLIEKTIEYVNNERESKNLTEKQKQKIAERLYSYIKFINNSTITENNIASFAEFYNGSKYKKNHYDTRFIEADAYLKKSLSKPDTKKVEGDTKTFVLNRGNFMFYRTYIDANNDSSYVTYSYVIQKGGTPGAVIGQFKEDYPEFADSEISVTNIKMKGYLSTKNFKKGDVVYVNIRLSS